MEGTTYKGFIIYEVFHYTNGLSDFNVYKVDDEWGWPEPLTTLEEVKQSIDEIRKYEEHETAANN